MLNPEIEIVLKELFAMELEIPFADGRHEAYKMAAQLTFGTAFDDAYIHGTQVIVYYDLHTDLWTPTFLYLAGIRFDKVFSAVAMLGFRSQVDGPVPAGSTERLVNLALFANLDDHHTVGIETNYSADLDGVSQWLVMPQWHWKLHRCLIVQSGVGAHFTPEHTVPTAGVRIIGTF